MKMPEERRPKAAIYRIGNNSKPPLPHATQLGVGLFF